MRTYLARATAVTIGALAVTGCGGGGSAGPSDAAVKYFHAIGARDYPGACNLITEHFRSQLEGLAAQAGNQGNCSDQLKFLMRQARKADKAIEDELKNTTTVTVLSQSGDAARVQPKGGKGVFTMQRVAGAWLVDSSSGG